MEGHLQVITQIRNNNFEFYSFQTVFLLFELSKFAKFEEKTTSLVNLFMVKFEHVLQIVQVLVACCEGLVAIMEGQSLLIWEQT